MQLENTKNLQCFITLWRDIFIDSCMLNLIMDESKDKAKLEG